MSGENDFATIINEGNPDSTNLDAGRHLSKDEKTLDAHTSSHDRKDFP